MNIVKKDNYTLIKTTQNTVLQVVTDLKKQYTQFKSEHIIIDISEKINIKTEELLLFLELSYQHQENGTSFVLVCKGINFDDISEKFNVVPTLIEAIDIIEMEAIERDLGF